MTNGDCFKFCVNDLKMAVPSEDMGFCSSEDYLENEIHSPTDSSEDSVEVKVSVISLSNKRRRIEAAPTETFSGPLKKRMCLKMKAEINGNHPFRPWSPTPKQTDNVQIKKEAEEPVDFQLPKTECQPSLEEKSEISNFAPYFRPPSPIKFYSASEPVPLIKKKEQVPKNEEIRVPIHPQIQSISNAETERLILKSSEIFPPLQNSAPSTSKKSSEIPRKEQRNYKNMTRERRIEANARERTRVHTISAAFETLRKSIPSYSHNQKLSKLSVLRIACSYIMTLSSILSDETDTKPSTSECVELVTRTIQREGKLRKKKDDND
ncbi:T-cell acute lymphocytic leukemia protein 1 [Diorhabda carinulata]|uniref:T-cell acute lymphocytic leukemia protein 1 n=1 Tax=Diorhabda carinulata TaxID=1163345 RepID=UPI0025A05556|nr:T-cell acute lymphocytic leukemia protein 1 [Diorhabda carinulata]